ncbi:MAG TPA: prolyl oligopeptidase family serine peptidase, partial [Hyphomonadaceae bacterium]
MARLLTRIAALALLAGLAACGPTEKAETVGAAPFMPKSLTPDAVKAADEVLWLEDINGERAMEWVKSENEKTKAVLEADPRYGAFQKEALAILTAQDRTPTPRFRAGGIDNFWQDQTNVHGLWRQTTLESYRSADPKWDAVLDIDALSKAENANWIYKGSDCLEPAETLCLVSLSDGGKDAVVVREFDARAKKFVEGGFRIPEGKHRISWLDQNTLLVATDFGAGSLTESGYPFIVKTLKRGQTLDQAAELYRGEAGDGGYGVSPAVLRDGTGKVLAVIVSRPLDTFRSETWEIVDGKPVKLSLPERATVQGALAAGDPELVFTIEEDANIAGRNFSTGALLSVSMHLLRPQPTEGPVSTWGNGDPTIFEPSERQSIEEVAVFDDRVAATIYDNVNGRALIFSDAGEFGGWTPVTLPSPENVAIHLGSTSRSSGRIFYTYEGFLTPSTLSLADVRTGKAEIVKQAPERFDASKHVVEQFEAKSSDGTTIPYFVVRPKDAAMDGSTPTLMFGYGGFQVSYPPAYKPELGKLWLERGGAYAVANIRGGGEFGPAWHQAALKGKRQIAFDDFAAVAADLAMRRITSPQHLAVYGRSNGGVLTSVMLTQHPELIGGAVIESPLVDMLRYHELPPGASWMGEYGDPRIPEEAAFIAKYSAYQNLRKGAAYPEVYITTNTRDDRVHPGHARKLAARLHAMGYPALYYETTVGGHSNDADPILNSERW